MSNPPLVQPDLLLPNATSTSFSAFLPAADLENLRDYLTAEEIALIVNPPYRLSLSLDQLLSPSKAPRNNPQFITPRPQNAWVIFRKDFESRLRLSPDHANVKMVKISDFAATAWKNQSLKVKRYFEVLKKIAVEKHRNLYPQYKYKPRMKQAEKRNKWVFMDSGSILGSRKRREDAKRTEETTNSPSNLISSTSLEPTFQGRTEIGTNVRARFYENLNILPSQHPLSSTTSLSSSLYALSEDSNNSSTFFLSPTYATTDSFEPGQQLFSATSPTINEIPDFRMFDEDSILKLPPLFNDLGDLFQ